MPRVFVHTLTIQRESIDALGHVNNQEYVRWMQDIAVDHSTAQGWPIARHLELGQGWVVRRHTVEYLRQAFEGDVLTIATWIAPFARLSSPRRFLFYRPADGEIVVRAETLFAFIDYAKGTPMRIPAEVSGSFEVADDAEALRVVRGDATD